MVSLNFTNHNIVQRVLYQHLKTDVILKSVYHKDVAALKKMIEDLVKNLQRVEAKVKGSRKRKAKVDLDCAKKESSKGFAAARQKNAQETETKRTVVLVEGDVKENKDSQKCSYIAECVEQTMEKLDLTLVIIDGVYPTTKWHVVTLDQVVWIISDK